MSFRRALLMRGADAPSADLVFYDRITTDGTAYIDTGLTLTDGTYVGSSFYFDMCISATQLPNTSSPVIFGVRIISTHNQAVLLTMANGTTPSIRYFNNTSVSSGVGFSVGERFNVLAKSDGLYVNGVLKGSFGASGKPYTSNPVKAILFGEALSDFFGGALSGTSRNIYTGYEFYQLKIDGADGTPIINLKPCTYQGVAGMWDLVTNTFFGNANTSGEFSVSND